MARAQTNLAGLFDEDEALQGNVSLQYKAPKAPKQQGQSLAAPPEPPAYEPPPASEGIARSQGLCYSGTVHAYRLAEGGYAPVIPPDAAEDGSLGLVVLGTTDGRVQVLVYDRRKVPVMSVLVSLAFNPTHQQGLYVSVVDGTGGSWSLLFKSEEELVKFARGIALARSTQWTAQHYPLIAQECVGGDKGAPQAEEGDTVVIRYRGWLEGPAGRGSLGQEFGDNLGDAAGESFTLGKGKVLQGWEEGVKGMRKGGKRVLVVPPHLGYGQVGLGSKIPANAVLIFEVTLEGVSTPQEAEAEVELPKLPNEGGTTIQDEISSLRAPIPEAEPDLDEADEEVAAAAGGQGEHEDFPAQDGEGSAKAAEVEGLSLVTTPLEHVSSEGGGGEGAMMLPSSLSPSENSEKEALRARMAKLSGAGRGGMPFVVPTTPDRDHDDARDRHAPEMASSAGHADRSGVDVGHADRSVGDAERRHGDSSRRSEGYAELVRAVGEAKREQGEMGRNLMARVGEVGSRVEELLAQGRRRGEGLGGGAELLVGQVLVDSVGKLVGDNQMLREDAIAMRERLEAVGYELKQAKEENKRLESILAEKGERGDSSAEIRALKQQLAMCEEEKAAAMEKAEDERLARERAEGERRKMRGEMQAERDRWAEEMDEERRQVDNTIAGLRETIRRLRLDGAGASEKELETLKTTLEEAAAEREAALVQERDEAVRRLGEGEAQRDATVAEKAALQADRDQASGDRATLLGERDAAVKERDAVRAERDTLAEDVRSRKEELAALREEMESKEEEIARAAKARIDKVKENARAQLPGRVKEVISRAYFALEQEVDVGEYYKGERMLSMVLGTLKNATLGEGGVPPSRAAEGREESAAIAPDVDEGAGAEGTGAAVDEGGEVQDEAVESGGDVASAVLEDAAGADDGGEADEGASKGEDPSAVEVEEDGAGEREEGEADGDGAPAAPPVGDWEGGGGKPRGKKGRKKQ